MKKTFSTQLMAGLFLLATIIGCSKDEILPTPDAVNGSALSRPGGSLLSQSTGAVSGTITNPVKFMSVTLANAQNSYGPIYLDAPTPGFRISGVQPGIYKLVVTSYGTSFTETPSVTVEVEVKAGQVTNVGTISL